MVSTYVSLVELVVMGENPVTPPAPAPLLNYSVDREEKGELQGSTNQLYYPYTCSV